MRGHTSSRCAQSSLTLGNFWRIIGNQGDVVIRRLLVLACILTVALASSYLQTLSVAFAAAGPFLGQHRTGNPEAENRGDVNDDGQVDILDVQLCVNVVLGTESDSVTVLRADVNQDGDVNVLDIQVVVNMFLAPLPTESPSVTATVLPTSTQVPRPTITPMPPTNTATQSLNPTATVLPTSTSVPSPTDTPILPTNMATQSPSATATLLPTSTWTSSPTASAVSPTNTPSTTPVPTNTPTATAPPPTETPPGTSTSEATSMPLPSSTPSPTTSAASAPYPYSTTIIGITWAPASSIIRQATGSDNWPLTWADDGSLYTAYGDGWGFDPKVPNKLSLGLARVDGSATNFSGVNIYPSDGQQTGGGSSGKKASGMLMVDGVLYMWVRNANGAGKQCQLAWSSDKALTWSWADWTFSELGYCAFLNFGKNYSGARDDYVYMYSPNTSSAYNETDSAVLTRVPRGKITDRSAYEFVKSVSGSGNPTWTSNISQRGTVFAFPGGVNRLDVTYNAGIGRYLMTMRSRAKSGGLNQFSIYDAPQPWGPWSTVFYTENWDTDPGEVQHIPSKWISGDGKTIYLIFAGNDSFSVRGATLTIQD